MCKDDTADGRWREEEDIPPEPGARSPEPGARSPEPGARRMNAPSNTGSCKAGPNSRTRTRTRTRCTSCHIVHRVTPAPPLCATNASRDAVLGNPRMNHPKPSGWSTSSSGASRQPRNKEAETGPPPQPEFLRQMRPPQMQMQMQRQIRPPQMRMQMRMRMHVHVHMHMQTRPPQMHMHMHVQREAASSFCPGHLADRRAPFA